MADKGKELEKLTPEQEYIKNCMEIYEVEIKKMNFTFYGKAVGVRFKIKNKGTQILSHVEVNVKYKDENGNVIYDYTLSPIYSNDYALET